MTKEESNLKIIQLLAEGKLQKEIAQELRMPIATVRDRILDMKRENQCPTQTALVVKMMREKPQAFAGMA